MSLPLNARSAARAMPRPAWAAVGILAITACSLAGPGPAGHAPSAVASSAASRTTPATLTGANWGDKRWGDNTTDANAVGKDGKNDPKQDAGSLLTITTETGARTVWASKDARGRAITGQGVGVALLDTGISTDIPGLDGANKVVIGPDLSFEANSPNLTDTDNYGHGTHLAGIIAARDAVGSDAKTGRPKPDTNQELGIAPDAQLVSVKLGTRDGSVDVSQVIAGLDWTVQHRNDGTTPIRVINLAYGTGSLQSYQLDPLSAAVENAWKHGIVVVVSGGNEGSSANGLTDPAINPFVISVGASDAHGVVGGWKIPSVATYSSRGTSARHVDLLAPGSSIASLRDPGSFVDQTNPQGLVTGDASKRLFRGSGTSQAAAVVSGAVALILQAYPNLTPDQVKALLTHSADLMLLSNPLDAGAGQLDVASALSLSRLWSMMPSSLLSWTTQKFAPATGLGTLEGARGESHVTDPDTGDDLVGELDVQSQPWKPAAWRSASVSATSWSGGSWNGARWTGDTWTGARWSGARWTGARWTGARWTDVSWDGAGWTGARWTGARWTGARWTGRSWL